MRIVIYSFDDVLATVELLLTDPPRSGHPLYNGQLKSQILNFK
jgi:hypothetical protein